MMLSPFESHNFKITSPYGTRTLNGVKEFHSGIDLVGIGNYNVVSVCDGTVIQSRIITDKSNLTWQWGNYVSIQASDGTMYYYCHLASRAVVKGAKVVKGQKIGVMGNTGYSFGAHLHFEVRKNNVKKNASEYLGIPNKVGTYNVRAMNTEYYIDGIIKKAKFSNSANVKTALLGVKHNYPDELYRKIYEAMK